MSGALLFGLFLSLIVSLGSGPVAGAAQKQQEGRPPAAPSLRFDGLYFADKGYYHSYMKFSADGTVADGHGKGIWNDPTKVSSSGRYEIRDSTITFTLQSPQSKVEYEGTIERNALKLTVYSHINQARYSTDYRFMTVREGPEGLILSSADKEAVQPAGTPVAESSKSGAQSPLQASKIVSLKAGDGLIQRIALINSGSGDAFGCILGGAAGTVDWTGEPVLWKLVARGKPGWDSGSFALRDDKGRDFVQFCNRSERNERGVFYSDTVFIGPADARKITVTFENQSVDVQIPAK